MARWAPYGSRWSHCTGDSICPLAQGPTAYIHARDSVILLLCRKCAPPYQVNGADDAARLFQECPLHEEREMTSVNLEVEAQEEVEQALGPILSRLGWLGSEHLAVLEDEEQMD
jgi:hypothetical protein